jgi:hypothetical protein
MTMMDIHLLTLLIGVFSVGLPTFFGVWFWQDKDGVGRVISYMLLGEAANMLIVLYFAWTSYVGQYNHLSAEVVTMLRWLLFATASLTTIKLIMYLKKVKSS